MERVRTPIRIFPSEPTIEGAGVRLRRAFGFFQVPHCDPFLLLDVFQSQNPLDYAAGFPWHPHRGIETITYLLQGAVEHQDNLGNRGVIGPGDVQWMTAGHGILHQEMPKGDGGGNLSGFQLWANLPAENKMMRPRYRGITSAEIPVVRQSNGVTLKIIAGTYDRIAGPVRDVLISPMLFDVEIPVGVSLLLPVDPEKTALSHIYSGTGFFGQEKILVQAGTTVLFGLGDVIKIRSQSASLRALLILGRPLREPIAWRGPMVMNSEAEIRQAYEDLQSDTFILRP